MDERVVRALSSLTWVTIPIAATAAGLTVGRVCQLCREGRFSSIWVEVPGKRYIRLVLLREVLAHAYREWMYDEERRVRMGVERLAQFCRYQEHST